ncbi:MAG: hypothetical protein KW793_04090 [Candidatus Doudnabacteria bacterium]|nr:hypothetical protein [Candidatus Doudnabacteria bacterium]
MIRSVYIDFGDPLSYEPKKWQKIINQKIYCPEIDNNDIRQRIQSCSLSEYTSSLNLEVDLDHTNQDELIDELKRLIPAFVGSIRVGTTGIVVVKSEGAYQVQVSEKAKVLLFPQKSAA